MCVSFGDELLVEGLIVGVGVGPVLVFGLANVFVFEGVLELFFLVFEEGVLEGMGVVGVDVLLVHVLSSLVGE